MPLLLQFPIALTLLNWFGIEYEKYYTYTYTLDCFWITSVIISARRLQDIVKYYAVVQERERHINLGKILGTPAGCPRDTRRNKQGSTGRCPRDFLLLL